MCPAASGTWPGGSGEGRWGWAVRWMGMRMVANSVPVQGRKRGVRKSWHG